MLRGDGDPDPQNNAVLRLLRRRVQTTEHLERVDLFIAHDETPEADRPVRGPLFGVTREPYVVFAATALALVGLLSMSFLLAGARDRFVYLDEGLAVILIFIGAKFLLETGVEIGVAVSLGVIVAVMGSAIAAPLLRDRR